MWLGRITQLDWNIYDLDLSECQGNQTSPSAQSDAMPQTRCPCDSAVTEWGEADLLSRNTKCVLRAPPTPAEATQCLIGCLVWIIIYTKTKNWYHSPCTFSKVIHIFHWEIEILCMMRHIIIITGLSECYQVEMNMWQNSNSPFVTARDTIAFSRDNVTKVTCYCHNLHQRGRSGKFQYYGVMVLLIDIMSILSSPGPKPQNPKPRGLGLTLKSHGPPPHP